MFDITEFIPTGKVNAIKRQDLKELCSLSDRMTRRMIQKARKSGAAVCNRQDGTGYYIADSKEDLAIQYKLTAARINELKGQLTNLKQQMKNMEEKENA